MRTAPLLLLLAILGAAAVGCDGEAENEPTEPTEPAVEQTESTEPDADDAPDELPRVELADLQRLIDETAAQDRVLMIDFWATWCIPCVQIFPELHEGLKAMGERVRPVSVTLDDPDYEPQAIKFLRQHHATEDAYMLMPESDAQLEVAAELGERWNDLVVPAILVFDAQGELAGEYLDAEAQPDAILAGVEAALNGQTNEQTSEEQGSVDAEDG